MPADPFWGAGPERPKQKTPPGNALLAKEQAALKRQAAGRNPSFTPADVVDAVGKLLNPPPLTVQAGGRTRTVQGGPVFNPLTAGLDVLRTAPSQVKAARKSAVRIAHPDENLRERDILAGLAEGAFGVPRGGTREPKGASTSAGKVRFNTTPRVPKGATTPETGGALDKEVRERLRGASAARSAQDKLYSAERSKRAGAAEQAMGDLGGRAGYEAALRVMKGELPKLKFGGFEDFDQEGLDALFTHIQSHPTLRPFEKIRAQRALLNVLDGRVPTRSELGLMGQVFGKEVSGRIAASVPLAAKAKMLGLELWNVPRSLMASFDLSAPFRQGLVAGVRYPRKFFANFGPMVKAFGSERAYETIMEDIHARPTFPTMQKAGLSLTELGPLEDREEQFVSNLAEKIPVVGRGVRASGRAYTGFLSKMRADVFDYLLEQAEKQGLDTTDERLLTSIARYVNSATGRGDLGAFQKHAVTLNSLFFSPRLLWSRLNFLNPVYYARLDPFARREALKAARNLVGTVGLTLFLADMAGADVNLDPRNADFAKIKVGNTRIDVLGGFQQPVRLLAQLFNGKIVSSTTGKTLTLGPQGPGKLSRKDILQRFAEQKLAPTPSFINDWFKGTDFADKPFSWKNAVFQRMVPLLVQDIRDLYHEEGSIPLAAGAYALAAFGIGFQTYGPKPPTNRGDSQPQDAFWGDTGGTDDDFWTGGGRSSGGDDFWGP